MSKLSYEDKINIYQEKKQEVIYLKNIQLKWIKLII